MINCNKYIIPISIVTTIVCLVLDVLLIQLNYNIFILIGLIIMFRLAFLPLIKQFKKQSHLFLEIENLVYVLLTLFVLSLFGLASAYWSVNTTHQNKNEHVENLNFINLIKYPFYEYPVKDSMVANYAPKNTGIKKQRTLLVLDKTSSTQSRNLKPGDVWAEKLNNMNQAIGIDQESVDNEKRLDERDKFLIYSLYQLYKVNSHKNMSTLAYVYYGDSIMESVLSDTNSQTGFIDVNSDNIRRIISKTIDNILKANARYKNKPQKTNIRFIIDALTNRDFDFSDSTYNLFSLISDFDDNFTFEQIKEVTINRSLSNFTQRHSFHKIALFEVLGNNSNEANQAEVIGCFRKNFRNTNSELNSETRCIVTNNYNNYFNSLRQTIDENTFTFMYPKYDSRRNVSAKLDLVFKDGFEGSIRLHNADLIDDNEQVYIQINSGDKVFSNSDINFKSDKKEHVRLNMYGIRQGDEDAYSIDFAPTGSNTIYKYKIAIKEYLPELLAVLLQVLYFGVFYLLLGNLLVTSSLAIYRLFNQPRFFSLLLEDQPPRIKFPKPYYVLLLLHALILLFILGHIMYLSILQQMSIKCIVGAFAAGIFLTLMLHYQLSHNRQGMINETQQI